MRLNLPINIATVTLLGSLCLLLVILAHQTKAQGVPEYGPHRRALRHRKRASSGSSGSSGPPNPTRTGPAWHEHPMWNHPALHQGAKLFPSSSESSSKSSSSLESTGTGSHAGHHHEEVTSHLSKGKGIASGSGSGSGDVHGLQSHSVHPGARPGSTWSSFRTGRPPGVKESRPRAPRTKKVGPTARMGRPPGTKDSKPRAPPQNKKPKKE